MVGGALLFAAALHPVTPLAPLAGGVLGLAAGASVVHGRAAWRVAAAGAALLPLFLAAPSGPTLALVAALVALGLAVGGPRGVRGALGAMIGAIVVLVAMWSALRIGHARLTGAWPPLAITAASAAAFGLVGSLALIPRHLEIALDPVRAAVKQLPAGLDAEIAALCARAAAIWTAAQRRISDDTGRALVRDGVVKTLEVAARSAEVKVTGPSDAELAQRAADLDARIAAAHDGEVVAQYRSARAAVADQQRHRDHIRRGRERLVARLHSHVAALETYELAATGLDAARAASAGSLAIRQLEELSHDVAASGEALAELATGEPWFC